MVFASEIVGMLFYARDNRTSRMGDAIDYFPDR
jgi:hypothetical protein